MQLYNGVALLATFFLGRVVWGNYQSIHIYSDVWTAMHTADFDAKMISEKEIFAYRKNSRRVGGEILSCRCGWWCFIWEVTLC